MEYEAEYEDSGEYEIGGNDGEAEFDVDLGEVLRCMRPMHILFTRQALRDHWKRSDVLWAKPTANEAWRLAKLKGLTNTNDSLKKENENLTASQKLHESQKLEQDVLRARFPKPPNPLST